ncbi:hypothetical protein D3C81_1222110 [compost metagenome]
MLADAADVAVRQGGEHGGGGVQAGEDIGQRHADFHRAGTDFLIGAPGNAHQAAEALDHEVIARAFGVGAGLAETGDRAVDQLRIDLLQRRIVEAIRLKSADLEVFQHDVGFCRQFADDALAFRLGEVDGDGLLVAVGRKEIGRLAGVAPVGVLEERRAPVAGVVADVRALDLDHFGAEVGEDLPGPGAGEYAGEVEDANVRESAGHRWIPLLGEGLAVGASLLANRAIRGSPASWLLQGARRLRRTPGYRSGRGRGSARGRRGYLRRYSPLPG